MARTSATISRKSATRSTRPPSGRSSTRVLDALEVVHSHGLFHLDLKPANLMMDQQGGVRLIDFGASKQMKAGSGATTSTAVSYTNGYAPREQMEQALDKFGPWTDFYALGMPRSTSS